MKRSALALAGLLALPCAAAAQQDGMLTTTTAPEILPHSRFAITPFVGVRVPYTSGRYVVFGGESGSEFSIEEERGGSAMVGLGAEARIRGPFSFVSALAFSGREQDIFIVNQLVEGEAEEFRRQADGPAIWFAKAGVAYRLPDPVPDTRRFHPSAFLSVAPAMVWVDWEEVDGVEEDITRTTRHFGLDLAADATSRIGRSNLAVTLGAEGMFTFWDFDALRVRDEVVFEDRFGEPVVIDYDYSASSIIFLRLGLSYRF